MNINEYEYIDEKKSLFQKLTDICKKLKSNAVFLVIWFILPLLLGTIGYCFMIGDKSAEIYTPIDALYCSFSLYFINILVQPYSSSLVGNILIHICRFYSPLVTLTGVALLFFNFLSILKNKIREHSKYSVVIYSDEDNIAAIDFWKRLKYGILSANNKINKPIKYRSAKNHIIMFDNDIDNLTFYAQHKSEMKGNIRIQLDSLNFINLGTFTDSKRENVNNDNNVAFFSKYEIIAREFWLNLNNLAYIASAENKNINIAIPTFNTLGKKIFETGLLCNIYSKEQRIEYHIFDDNSLNKSRYSNFNTMNNDEICFHSISDLGNNKELLNNMDLIILTGENELKLLDYLILFTSPKTKIFIYMPNNTDISLFYNKTQGENVRILSFGHPSDIYNVANTLNFDSYEIAKRLNYIYEKKLKYTNELINNLKNQYDNKLQNEVDEYWSKLNNYHKSSSISQGEYIKSVNKLLELLKENNKKIDLEQLAEFEHIRWCRFHFLDNWSYAEEKNTTLKRHNCLIPFNQLDDNIKGYDRILFDYIKNLHPDLGKQII